MSKVAVVTDSTAYIPSDLSKGYPLHFVPLQVIWGEETFRDGIDIQPTDFYNRLKTAKTMPTTSQPSPAAFSEVYRSLIEDGYQIISIHISSKLSGTIDSAMQARDYFPGERIEVVDSESASMALGFQALSVARAAAQGATLQECRALAEKARQHIGLMFAVNTLEFLRRGGRIGGAAAFLGTALNLKPLLELRNGRIEAMDKVRTMNKAIDRLLDVFEERVAGRYPVRISVIHAAAQTEAELLLERARQRFSASDVSETVLTEVSPVLGTHTGPGCMGIAYMAGM